MLIHKYPEAINKENNRGNAPRDLLWNRKMESNTYETNLDAVWEALKEPLGVTKQLSRLKMPEYENLPPNEIIVQTKTDQTNFSILKRK